jgi:DNA polymerase-3 subunit delta
VPAPKAGGAALPRVFLFTGPEAGEKKAAVEDIKAALKKKAGAVDEFTFYAYETDVSKAVMLLQNESLFAAARFVLFRSAELIKKKEDIDALAAWIEGSVAHQGLSTLVLESDENSVDKRLENKVPKENRRVFWEMFANKKEAWVRGFLGKAGYRITGDAVSAILGLVENNTETLAAECSRFFLCYARDHEITADDAESLLYHNREESAFTLFAALTRPVPAAERLENSLGILQKIRGGKDGAPQAIIPGLVWCFRRLADWRALCAETPDPSPLDCKRAGFGHSEVQAQYRNAARIWDAGQSARSLALLAACEAETRFTASEAHGALLETLLYSLVFKKGEPLERALF